MIKSRKHKFYIELYIMPIAIIFLFTLLYAGVNYALTTMQKEEEQQFITLNDMGQAVVDAYITTLFEQGSLDPKYTTGLYDFPMGSRIYQEGRKYFVRLPGKKTEPVQINPDYPLFMDGGRYLYLYHEEFELVTEELIRNTSREKSYISEGKVFNEENFRAGDYEILLLKLPNGLYINTRPLIIENGRMTETIESNSVLKITQKTVSYCNPFVRKPQLEVINLIDSMVMLQSGDLRLPYDSFFEAMSGTSEERAEVNLDKLTVEEDIYQYFLSVRYDYKGRKDIYQSRAGYFCEMGENRFFLPSVPIYYSEERYILLPCDYVLIQPELFMMNRLSALTKVSQEEGLTHTSREKILGTYRDVILFDGADTYLFFTNTELTWGDNSLILTPMSFATVAAGSLEIYDYEAAQYQSYMLDGITKVLATTEDGASLNLSEDILYRPDGQEQILFSDPSMLTEVR